MAKEFTTMTSMDELVGGRLSCAGAGAAGAMQS